ncbi:MAG: AMMECR1 domain-containing protein, partial [Candidatus Margulisbacteria bacterium]|nr:AMMECR1 domain-containing protein [Candidatus Margulisiibacteriota bacterium]
YKNNILLPFEVEGYFITFKDAQGKTRGCSGELRKMSSIPIDILGEHIEKAKNFDPRYKPIKNEEIKSLNCFFSLILKRSPADSIYNYNPKITGFIYEANGRNSILLPGEAKTTRWALLELRRQAGFAEKQAGESLEIIKTRLWVFPVSNPEKYKEY